MLLTLTKSFCQLTGHVNYEKIGIELDIPAGWFGQETETSLVLGSQTIPGIVTISTHNYSINELRVQAQKGIFDQNGTALRLSGQLQEIDPYTIAGEFEGMLEYQQAKAFIIGKENTKGGPGVTIMAATLIDMYSNEHQNIAKEVSGTVKFNKINRTAEFEEWKSWLSNVRLTYMDSYYSSDYTDEGVSGGYSSETTIDLCSKGFFNFNSSSDMSVSSIGVSGYGSSGNAGEGTWNIQMGTTGEVLLILTFHDGSKNTYELSYENEKLYLNGYRYFRTTEGEYAPNCY